MTIGGPVCLWYASKHEVWLFTLFVQPTVTHKQAANKEPPLTTVPFIRVVLTVVVMVTDPTVRNAAQIITTKLALCARTWSWGKTWTEIKKSQMCHGFLNAVYKFCPYYDIKHPHYIKQFAQLLLCSELMSSLETNSLGISAATRGAVPPWLNPSHRFSVEKLHYHY